jgi:hypothetical protein
VWKFIGNSGFTEILSKDNGAVPPPLRFLKLSKDTFRHADASRSITLIIPHTVATEKRRSETEDH